MAQKIVQRFADEGFGVVQQASALANAIAESGLDPSIKAAGDEDSWGLFQLNHQAGLGVGHTIAKLTDPDENIGIIISEVKKLEIDSSSLLIE